MYNQVTTLSLFNLLLVAKNGNPTDLKRQNIHKDFLFQQHKRKPPIIITGSLDGGVILKTHKQQYFSHSI